MLIMCNGKVDSTFTNEALLRVGSRKKRLQLTRIAPRYDVWSVRSNLLDISENPGPQTPCTWSFWFKAKTHIVDFLAESEQADRQTDMMYHYRINVSHTSEHRITRTVGRPDKASHAPVCNLK